MKKTLLNIFGPAVLALAMAGAPAAYADLINGEISFDGAGFEVDTGALSTATAFTSFEGVTVSGATGDYAGTDGTSVTMNGFSLILTEDTLWWEYTLDGVTYKFTLTSVTDYEVSTYGGLTTLTVYGTGIASITGMADTAGSWVLTANSSRSTCSFSASTAVPDGGATVMLLGFGLVVAATVRRRIA